MASSELLRLEHIVADGLFDIYNHSIRLNLEDRVTLLHGPNGVGKTVVLQMVDALLRGDLDYFHTIPFSRFLLAFDDNSVLDLTESKNGSDESKGTYWLTLTRGRDVRSAKVRFRAPRAEAVAAQIDYLRPHNRLSDHWTDVRDGELLSASEVLSRFGSSSPTSHFEDEDASWFNVFLRSANAHLIAAQRLVRVDWESQSRYFRPMPTTVSTVIECSEDFQKRLGDTMAQYGRQAQALDQSFPQRLISATEELTVDDLQERMATLDNQTAELTAIGILEETPTHPFPVSSLGDLDSTQARVMTLYVQDTASKLQALDDLARRARLLVDNVNQKYRHKRIRVDREEGFVAESDKGQLLPLNSLSSGEQHELVLHYDLLFRVPSNTIVLIDEPELSLHVAWQRRFLDDLLDIVRLSDFDALVATHSPFVIGDRDDLMVGLGDTD